MRDIVIYPRGAAARDAFVLDRRPPRPALDPWRHQGVIVEDERQADGTIARVATVFLTGRECPWRCVMCDLWRHTIADDTPIGSLPSQIAAARRETSATSAADTMGAADAMDAADGMGAVTQMKLYNAGSFFDPRAVPEDDYDAIAAALAGLDRVIVESHPALVGSRIDRFRAALGRPALEVAMGLETAHPDALEQLHKTITVDRFARAAGELRSRGVALRVFLLIAPPFVPADEQDEWLLRSIDIAFACGATAISLIPTRPGNGAMESLAAAGLFRTPTLDDIERSVTAALAHVHGRSIAAGAAHSAPRVFVDLWDLARFADDARSVEAARQRLHAMNLDQRVGAAPAGEAWHAAARCDGGHAS